MVELSTMLPTPSPYRLSLLLTSLVYNYDFLPDIVQRNHMCWCNVMESAYRPILETR